MSSFEGFGTQTSKFLRGLGKNNNKAWFTDHRDEYEAHYMEPAKAFIEEVGPKLEKLSPSIVWEPRVNGSIFRVNRDIRFSKDKTPYKDHIDMWFWEGTRKTALSGFFLRIRHDKIALGAGCHGFQKQDLSRYRKALGKPKAVSRLHQITKKLTYSGFEIGGKHYKRPPRGFDEESVAGELALHNALWASFEKKHPPDIKSKKFAAYCAREWKKLLPLHHWLVDEVRG